MSEYGGLTVDTAKFSQPNPAYEALVTYPQEFEPFYEIKSLGQGSFGEVSQARIKDGFFVTIPKVRVHYYRAGPSVQYLTGHNYRLQTNSKDMQR